MLDSVEVASRWCLLWQVDVAACGDGVSNVGLAGL